MAAAAPASLQGLTSATPEGLRGGCEGAWQWGSACCWTSPAECWGSYEHWGRSFCGGRDGCSRWRWRTQPRWQTRSSCRSSLWSNLMPGPGGDIKMRWMKCTQEQNILYNKQIWKSVMKYLGWYWQEYSSFYIYMLTLCWAAVASINE